MRSLLFNVAFYANLILWLIMLLPTLVMPRRFVIAGVRAWSRSNLWLMRVTARTSVVFRNLDRIPPGGLMVAAKHQSFWETFALMTVVEDPAFILKRELMWIPFFGWLAWKAGMIPIDRKGGTAAFVEMNRRAAAAVASGRQLIIFPEGTRRAPGAPPAYKQGVAHLYRAFGVPCLPVALASGWFWPRRQFLRRPGTIVVEILEPLPPGLPRDVFMKAMQEGIETASDRLLAQAKSSA